MSAILYQHDDGQYAVAATAEAATFANDTPEWHRVGPVDIVGMLPENIDYEALWADAQRTAMACGGSLRREFAIAVLIAHQQVCAPSPLNGADNEVQQPNKTDLAAPAVLPLLPKGAL